SRVRSDRHGNQSLQRLTSGTAKYILRLACRQSSEHGPSQPAGLRKTKNIQKIWSLDRLKHTWFLSEDIRGAFPPLTRVYGFNGEDLMTSGFDTNLGDLLVRYTLSDARDETK